MLTAHTTIRHWPLRLPFRIAGQVMLDVPVIQLTLSDSAGHCGYAEAAGIDYDGETPASMQQQIERVANQLHDDLDPHALLTLLPRGGARNALDCALWDLRAKQQQRAIAQGWENSKSALDCVYTIGMGDEDEFDAQIAQAMHYQTIKIKVDAHEPIARVQQVRTALPSKTIIIDANQSWSFAQLLNWQQALSDLGVRLIEQPLPRDHDEALRGKKMQIPLAADESCTDSASLEALQGKYEFINIKLDKCGGFSEALKMVELAQQLQLRLMVGNMCGSSLAMAPAFFIGQFCEIVDLDGPLLQSEDCAYAMTFEHGKIAAPDPRLWG